MRTFNINTEVWKLNIDKYPSPETSHFFPGTIRRKNHSWKKVWNSQTRLGYVYLGRSTSTQFHQTLGERNPICINPMNWNHVNQACPWFDNDLLLRSKLASSCHRQLRKGLMRFESWVQIFYNITTQIFYKCKQQIQIQVRLLTICSSGICSCFSISQQQNCVWHNSLERHHLANVNPFGPLVVFLDKIMILVHVLSYKNMISVHVVSDKKIWYNFMYFWIKIWYQCMYFLIEIWYQFTYFLIKKYDIISCTFG